jgi:predicted ATPase/DNA-binding CsgD family transcriptional regulator
MPAVRTTLLGRDRELSALLALLRSGDGPVTVTGPGGVGKTRLATEAARDLEPELADGAAFVDLANVRQAQLVADEVGRALDLSGEPGVDGTDHVAAALRHRHLLLVLDNFEQVAAAAPFVVALTARCPKLTVLVTARRRLDILGEHVVELGPLALPAAAGRGEPANADLAAVPSVALFCERAAAVNSRFQPDPATLSIVGELCRRLDGLPLAIELVAAHARQMSVDDLLSAIGDSGPTSPATPLDSDASGAAARHRDLASAIRFSYDLASDDARRLLRRLSVFDGGWSIDAMDDVCNEGARPWELLDTLSELTDLHLAEPATQADGPPRFRLLETIRHFAREGLRCAGEWEVIADRHAEFFADFAVEAGRRMESRRARQSATEIDRELANIRAALDHLSSAGRHTEALRATAALGRYWLVRGPATEGLRRMEGCLERHDDAAAAPDAEAWAGRLSFELFDADAPASTASDPLARIERGRDALSASGDEWAYLRATVHLAYALRGRGEAAASEEIADHGVQRCTTPDTVWWQAELLNQKALAVRDRDREEAALLADRAIEAARAAGHERGLADATYTRLLLDMDRGLATIDAVQGLYDQCEEIGNRRVQAIVAMCAGAIAARHGDPSAGRWYLRAIDIGQETGYYRATWWAMSGLVIALATSRPRDAGRIHGSLLAWSDELLPMTSPGHRRAYERAVRSLRDALGEEDLARLVRAGEDLAWDDAVDAARTLAGALAGARGLDAVGTRRRRGPRPNPEITERELEVLSQLVRGHTNQEIAEALGISPKTVMHHTTSVYRKLAVRGRAEAVAHAVRSGLVADG